LFAIVLLILHGPDSPEPYHLAVAADVVNHVRQADLAGALFNPMHHRKIPFIEFSMNPSTCSTKDRILDFCRLCLR
jgi:hypothetical protein